jgi:CRISPR-associated protein Cas1
MPTLYVVEQGARLEKEYRRLLVTKHDEVLLRVPLRHVTQVVLVGHVGFTTPALHALLRGQVPVLLVRRTGALVGRLLPPTPRNLPLRRAQYRRNDEAHFTLDVARAIVRGKLHNQRVLALRVLRRRPGADRAPLDALRAAEAQVEDAEGVEVLRGVEGAGARAYFACYRQAFDAAWGFERRTRRPPKDPVNALLSLGYTLLGHALMTALEAAGLDPYLGFFHVEKYGRPALALDLVEEFRAPFVDSLVMRLINWRMLQREDFWTRHDGATYLDDAGLKVFLREFGDRLERTVRLAGTKRALSYRKHFEVQARRMARAVLGSDIDDEGAGREAAAYVPFNAR